MKVIHNIYSVGPASFGLGAVALNLVREQLQLGCAARIWSLDNDEDRAWALATGGLDGATLATFRATWPSALGLSLSMEQTARSCADAAIIHQHAIWKGVSRCTNIMRKTHGIPTVVAPHGSLEEWALKKSSWKKRIALSLYERENLNNATCLHACSKSEVAGFRELGLKSPVAVIPNGIGEGWLESQGDGSRFKQKFGIAESKRILLYLSRITPIKGIPLLIEALAAIQEHLSDWQVVIAGADEFGHLAEVQHLVDKHQLKNLIVFPGMLKDQLKRDAFAAADLFVLPTLHEAAPVVVLEALGAAVPTITTMGAPWQDLENFGCGWWTEIAVDGLVSAIRDATRCSPDELQAMGARGRELVASRYTWRQSASMTIELYQWLLGHRDRPAFVFTD